MKKEKLAKLADRVKELREKRGMSQAQLAEAAGLNASLLSRLLAEDRGWHIEQILAVARALEMTPLDLVADTESVKVLGEWVPQIEFDKAERGRLLAVQELEALRTQVKAQSARLAIAEPLARDATELRQQFETMKMLASSALYERDDLQMRLNAILPHWEACKVSNAALQQAVGQANRQLVAVQQEAARTNAKAGMLTGLSLIGAALLAGRK